MLNSHKIHYFSPKTNEVDNEGARQAAIGILAEIKALTVTHSMVLG